MSELDYKRLKSEMFKLSILGKLVKKNKKEIKNHLDLKSLRNKNDELGYFNSLDSL